MNISNIHAREVLDSRGNPTVEVEITLENDAFGRGIAPSGASTGEKEAMELRDADKHRYNGKGVEMAVGQINKEVADSLKGKSFETQQAFDRYLIELDGTVNKSRLGANAILAASIAFAKAMAVANGLPLYRQLIQRDSYILPVPCMNVINGGRHADNNIDFQEFMIAPHNAPSFKESLRMGQEVFHSLKAILNSKGYYTGVGDEGGFAPNLRNNEEAVDVILEAIHKAGYTPGADVSLCIDPASSEMFEHGKYKFYKSTQQLISTEEMIALWERWVKLYPIVLLEDPLGEHDYKGWQELTQRLGNNVELVGDDIFCTNTEFLAEGIKGGIGNSILIKLNQVGTVTETLETIAMAQKNNYRCFISHRSGETEDTTIADLVVATNAGHIKTGSGCRSERMAKYNQLLRIEEELGSNAVFAGIGTFDK
jgi:enolase